MRYISTRGDATTTEALDRLAISSGGDLREFFRLLRLCLTAVRDDSQLPLASGAVAHAENAARADMLPIPADHLSWLKDITDSHDCRLPSDAKLPVLSQFLDNRLVLNYRNGKDWYDVHPLLRDVVDAHVRPKACTRRPSARQETCCASSNGPRTRSR